MIFCSPVPQPASDRGRLFRALAGVGVLALVLAGAPSARGSELYGLVIGINDYPAPIPALDGAVNDADDVAEALRQRNARRVWLLKDREVTRDRIFAAWQELTAQAQPGDFVVIHIAGHGARSPEKVPGTGTNGLDEFFVLPGFAVRGAGTRERIINKEWGGLLRQVPQLKIVFIADTCHSGSMTRAYAPRRLRARVAAPVPIELRDDALSAPDPARWVVTPDQLSHVVFFGAVGQDELDPEVLIDQRPRGALSWAVANGLRGMADLNQDGVVTKGELVRYVTEAVVSETEGEQHPRVLPGQVDLALSVPKAKGRPDLPSSPPPLSLEILGVGPDGARSLVGRLRGITLAAPNTPADLTWDVGRGQLRNQFQDVLIFTAAAPGGEIIRDYHRVGAASAAAPAENSPESLARIQAAIDKEALAGWLVALADRQPLSLRLSPKDALQHGGDHAVLSVADAAYPNLTLVNIGPTGNINLIYPLPGDQQDLTSSRPFRLDLTASAPFGAEHFIAFVSAQPLTALHQGLGGIDGQPRLDVFHRLVADAVQKGGVQVGVHTVFTAP
jgi:hypothetical protein